MTDEILKAYLAGWKGCIDSLNGQPLELPKELGVFERELAEQCFHEDYGVDK